MEKWQWSVETVNGTQLNGAWLERTKISSVNKWLDTTSFIADWVNITVRSEIINVNRILNNLLQ